MSPGVRVLLVTLLLPALAACGSGGGTTPPSGLTSTTIEGIDGPFNAFASEPFALAGTGFGPVGGTVTVRFTTVGDPVFDGGASEFADVEGTVESPTLIRGMTPIAIASGTFTTFVGVDLPGPEDPLSFVPIANFIALEVEGADVAEVDSDVPATILITGDGFEPVGGTADVAFIAETDAFLGGTVDRVEAVGDILSETEIQVTTPVAGASANAATRIQVLRSDGFQGSTAPGTLTFLAPELTSASTTSIEAENTQTLILTGRGFAPDNDPVVLRFTLDDPPAGGPSVFESAGTILEAIRIEADTPEILGLTAKSNATLEVVFPSGAVVPFAGGTFTFEPDPDGVDDAFDVIGNVKLVIEVDDPTSEGLLANDSDPDAGDTLEVVGIGTTGTAGDVTFETDGGFTYDPAPGFTGTDTFTYTLTDGVAEAVATVTLTVHGRRWFIRESAAAGGDGRLGSPFKTLAEFNDAQALTGDAAPAAGDLVFVFEGDSASYEGGIELLDDMILVGESEGLTVRNPPGAGGTDVEVVAEGDTPNLGHESGGAAITLAADNTIRGINIDNQDGVGLFGRDVGTLVIRDMKINSLGGEAIDIAGGTLDLELSSVFCAPTEATTPVDPEYGILLDDVEGTLDIVLVTTTDSDGETIVLKSGVVQIRDTTKESVKITNSSADLDVGIQELEITSPGATGLLVDTVDGSFLVDGRMRISTPPAGAALARFADCDSEVRIDSVSLTGALYEETPGGGSTLTVVGGHGIELDGHEGSFAIRGGSMGQFGDSAIHAEDCGADITLDGTIDHDGEDGPDGLVIHSTGIAAPPATAAPRPAHGVALFECTGAITIEGCEIRVMQERVHTGPTPPADGFDENNAVHLENTEGTLASLTIEANRLAGTRGDPGGSTAALPVSTDFGVRVVLDGTAIATTIEILDNEAVDLEAGAFGVVLDPGEDGTTARLPRVTTLTIRGNGRGQKLDTDGVTLVDRDALANHLGEIVLDVRGKSEIGTLTIRENTMTGDNDLATGTPFTRGDGILLRLGEVGGTGTPDADVTGTIDDNVLLDLGNGPNDVGIGIRARGTSTLVLLVDDNTVDGLSGAAIDILVEEDAVVDLTLRDNELGLIEANDEVDAAAMAAVLVALSIACADDSTLCLEVDGNQTAGDIEIDELDASALSFDGITGTPAPTAPYTDAEVEGSLAAANNTATGATGAIRVSAGDAAGACNVQLP